MACRLLSTPDQSVAIGAGAGAGLAGPIKDLEAGHPADPVLLHVEGFAGIARGMELIRRLLQEHWEGPPRLDPDDGDPTMRLNALAALSATESVLGDIRSSLLLDSPAWQAQGARPRSRAGRLEAAPGEARLAGPELAGLLPREAGIVARAGNSGCRGTARPRILEATGSPKGQPCRVARSVALKQLLQMVVAAMNSNAGLPNAARTPTRKPGLSPWDLPGYPGMDLGPISWDCSGDRRCHQAAWHPVRIPRAERADQSGPVAVEAGPA